MRFGLIGSEELEGLLRHVLTSCFEALNLGPLFVQVRDASFPFVSMVQVFLGQMHFPLRLPVDCLQGLLKSG